MQFSTLLQHLSGAENQPFNLANDPELNGAAALNQALAGELSFLEPGNALLAALAETQASALILPPDSELHGKATERGIAWVALKNPRLGFAESLEQLYPKRQLAAEIHPTAVIDPTAELAAGIHVGAHVVIGANCKIGADCIIHPAVVIYPDVEIGACCELNAQAVLHPGSRLADSCVVHSHAVIGSEGFGFVPTADGWRKMPQTGLVVLENGVEIGCGSTIDRPSVGETRIGAGSKIDNLVQVGHGVSMGKNCALAAQVGIAGGAKLGNGVILAGQVGVANRAVIGDGAIASSKSGIHGEVAAGGVVSGYPAIPNRLWLRCSAVFSKLPEMARSLRQLNQTN